MYGQSAECEKPIRLHLENFIAFQTVIQELRAVCDDKKGAHPQMKCRTAKATQQKLHSSCPKIRGGTPAQEMGLGKGSFLKE